MMKTRKEISEIIEKFLDNELGHEESDEFLRMISKNPQIKEEFVIRQKIDKSLRKNDVMELREELSTLFHDRKNENLLEEPQINYNFGWYYAAAVIVLMLGLGYMLLMQSGGGNSKPEELISSQQFDEQSENKNRKLEIIQKEEIPQQTEHINLETASLENNDPVHEVNSEDILLAMNYAASDYFESFIDNFRSEEIEIISPKGSAEFIFGSEIVFKWSLMQKDSLLIRIFNNREENIYNFVTKQQYLFNDELEPGLYYWKLESDEDLLYMNKFIIK